MAQRQEPGGAEGSARGRGRMALSHKVAAYHEAGGRSTGWSCR
jgi:hypothetical protein